MKISFMELAIDMRDFNGRSSSMARALVINKACDYIMHYLYPHMDEENIVPHADLAIVNFVTGTVELPVTLHPEFH
ncbi:MAG: hypothetical protein EBY16_10260 [Gammaproteobacteria bacterium]|nr:hypothetical protein [Gammaproteobacteria bacterium]